MSVNVTCTSNTNRSECASLAIVQKAEEIAAAVPEVADPTMLSQDMLRKYITFAKQNCHPRLANANVEKISQVSCSLCVTSTHST